MKTLNEIAKEFGVSLQTVYNWKSSVEEELGRRIEGVPHPNDKRKVVYSPDAVALITQGRSPIAVEVEVEAGDDCSTLAQPELAGTRFSLKEFRSGDVETLTFDDPAAIADQFVAVADLLIQGMCSDLEQRERRLQETHAAQKKVAEKAQELKLEQRLYRDRARHLDATQTEQTRDLQAAVEALQGLGKPAPNGGDAA